MINLLQSFVANGRFWARKSTLLLLLACALLVAEGCSKKIPCPDVTKETKKAKKKKKAKVVAPTAGAAAAEAADGGGGEATATATEETETTAPEEESSDSPERKAPAAGAKNHYTKGGLLKKGKYKRLRSNPNKKVMRSKHRKGGKSKTKTKRNNVGPVAE